ncbi:hypothetical protein AUL38_00155 [Leucobacter sp. G161]|nr:hypothetical protein AUL38_00155 [Leucobacter sp. G161]
MDISFTIRQSENQLSRFDDSAPAIRFEDQEALSFSELRELTWQFSNGLHELGVRPGDRVGLALHNSVEYWALYLAATRLGAIAVRINFRLRSEELEFILQDSGCKVLVAETHVLDSLEAIRDELPVLHYFGPGVELSAADWWANLTELRAASSDEPNVALPDPSDPAMLMYTSGTTGSPKGVIWSHSNTLWYSAMQRIEWGYGQETVTQLNGPIHHVGALENFGLPTLLAGGTVVVFGSTGFSLERALEVAENVGTTELMLFPSMLQELTRKRPDELAGLHRVRRIVTGGDTVSPVTANAIKALLPNVELTQVYGLTEGTPIAVSSPPGLMFDRPELVGIPSPYTEVSIRDQDGRDVPAGVAGEIWTRSPAGSLGYWNRPEENDQTFIDGWCRTGDGGVIEGGHLKFTARLKDIIRSGGENLSPAEIENVLKRHPEILDAAVIGVPHPALTETVCAVVVKKEGAAIQSEDVVAYCGQYLAGFKKPRAVMFVDQLPRNPSQKVQKFILREQFATTGIPVA